MILCRSTGRCRKILRFLCCFGINILNESISSLVLPRNLVHDTNISIFFRSGFFLVNMDIDLSAGLEQISSWVFLGVNYSQAVTWSVNVPVLSVYSGIWLKVLERIAFNNYVSFGHHVYRQVRRQIQGHRWLRLHICINNLQEILINSGVQFQSRYIDNGLIRVNTKEDTECMMASLNSVCDLKFTFEISNASGVYLDVQV